MDPCPRCPLALGATCLGPTLGLCDRAGDPAWDRHITLRSALPTPASDASTHIYAADAPLTPYDSTSDYAIVHCPFRLGTPPGCGCQGLRLCAVSPWPVNHADCRACCTKRFKKS